MFVDDPFFGPEFGPAFELEPDCDPCACACVATPAARHTASASPILFTHSLLFNEPIATMLIVSNPLANRDLNYMLNLLFFLTDAIPALRYAKSLSQNPQPAVYGPSALYPVHFLSLQK